jgi:hypothetical protein
MKRMTINYIYNANRPKCCSCIVWNSPYVYTTPKATLNTDTALYHSLLPHSSFLLLEHACELCFRNFVFILVYILQCSLLKNIDNPALITTFHTTLDKSQQFPFKYPIKIQTHFINNRRQLLQCLSTALL